MPPRCVRGEERKEVTEEGTVAIDLVSERAAEEAVVDKDTTELHVMLLNFMKIQQTREERMEQDAQRHEQQWRAVQHQFSQLQEEVSQDQQEPVPQNQFQYQYQYL
ncbi:hypothetical protein EOD39_10941 [Acipenser ruthenus]|uniref:Uncharacterized protein n=1 Tax=Acipenser ruthenus TaxID=7906 RepID=A0A444TWJ5_ACIRT|nr:hypothetical protein EOD39_10941 [Acipenser ruthenus]